MELILTGRSLSAREADARGLVTRVGAAEATVAAALDLAAPHRDHAAAGGTRREGLDPRRFAGTQS